MTTGALLAPRVPAPIDLRVSISPQASMFGMVRALSGEEAGVPGAIRREIVRKVDQRAVARVLWPFRRGDGDCLPDCVAPWWVEDMSVARFGDWLRSSGAMSLQRDVLPMSGVNRASWEPEAARPFDWLDAYARASASIWSAMESFWRQRTARLDAEVHRIGVAQVRGSTDTLLHTLHPRIGYDDGHIVIGGPYAARIPLAGRTLNLVPMIAGQPQILVHTADPDVVTLSYALPDALGSSRGTTESGTRTEDGLALVLGPARARLLRLLGTARTMGALARLSALAPSTVSHHCDLLENAGLIVRQRVGQAVKATLTPRGATVVDLLS